jgi:hypothetical protein
MGNSKDERKLRRLLLRTGHSPQVNRQTTTPQSGISNTKTPAHLASVKRFLLHIPQLWKWLLFLLGIPGLYIGIVCVVPVLTIEPQSALHANEPFHFPVRVSNTGYIGANSVKLQCNIDKAIVNHSSFTNLLFHDAPDIPLGDIGRGGFTSTFCMGAIGIGPPTVLNDAHITITLRFRPDLLPFTIRRRFFLSGFTDDNQQVHWLVTSN